MTCAAGKDGIEYLLDFEWVQAVTCTYADVVGLVVLGMLVYTAVGASIYIRTGSVVIPFGLLFLSGGAIMTQVAAPAVQFATLVVLLVGGGVFAYAYHRYNR